MTAAEAIRLAKGSFIKARRLYIRHRNWRNDEWYEQWPINASEWEAVAKLKQGM